MRNGGSEKKEEDEGGGVSLKPSKVNKMNLVHLQASQMLKLGETRKTRWRDEVGSILLFHPLLALILTFLSSTIGHTLTHLLRHQSA